MRDGITIRKAALGELSVVEQIYEDAFPEEDLTPLARQLWGKDFVAQSLIGEADGVIAGHGFFTTCHLPDWDHRVALLGPLGVKRQAQGRGVGSAIIQVGLSLLTGRGFSHVFVLGDPAYYSRLGFSQETRVHTPFELKPDWAAAWQSLCLLDMAVPVAGTLEVPGPWDDERLWS